MPEAASGPAGAGRRGEGGGARRPWATGSAVAAGGAMLAWPALLNGHPLAFSDTGAFLHQTLGPLMIWDKPWVYGPLLHAFHWRLSLWGPVLAQGLMLSHLLWLAQRATREGGGTPGGHLLVCGGAATLTAAPWVAALLMPDVLAPAVVLVAVLLGFARASLSRGEVAYLWALGAGAVASHLSHVPLALAMAVLVGMVARSAGAAPRAAVPLAGGVAILLATNLAGHGVPSLSPHGATFLLARLVANGTAARTVEAECAAGRAWYLCAWAGRLPADSDDFLWRPDSPVNRDAAGNPRFLGGATLSAEAREVVAATLAREPGRVALDALRDFGEQLVTARVGDTLAREHLGDSVRPRIAQGFPASALAAYDASAQARGDLPRLAAPFLWPHAPVLVLGAAALVALAGREHRRAVGTPRRLARLGLALGVLVGVAANALATGALSKPHHRYGARVAWLMPAAALLLVLPAALGAAGVAARRRGDGEEEDAAAVATTGGRGA